MKLLLVFLLVFTPAFSKVSEEFGYDQLQMFSVPMARFVAVLMPRDKKRKEVVYMHKRGGRIQCSNWKAWRGTARWNRICRPGFARFAGYPLLNM
ncbi:unnamed protein product [Caenorhabditis sp. 36 PRJEB53466]|nr:unnamed protein product [Caenorhabditis sp. 36 PRJEB53466]